MSMWYFNDGPLPSNANADVKNLIIFHIQLANKGYYVCEGTTENYNIFLTRAKLLVNGKFKQFLLLCQ